MCLCENIVINRVIKQHITKREFELLIITIYLCDSIILGARIESYSTLKCTNSKYTKTCELLTLMKILALLNIYAFYLHKIYNLNTSNFVEN